MSEVLVVGDPNDVHVRLVRSAVEKRGAATRSFDIGSLGSAARLAFRPLAPDLAEVSAAFGWNSFDGVDTVWYRRQGRARIAADLTESDRAFAQREWDLLVDGIMLSLEARFVNPIHAQRAAVKPRQLVVASRSGLRVPDTLVTNDDQAAAAFIERHRGRIIHKTMSPPRNQFAATQRWDDRHRGALADLHLAPAMFQEEIKGPGDVRVIMIGERVFAAHFESDPRQVDSRLNRDAPCRPSDLPSTVTTSLHRLMESLGLVFGVVDLRVTHQGEHVFLEVNPQGQFLYVEMLTGLPLTHELARLLAGPNQDPCRARDTRRFR